MFSSFISMFTSNRHSREWLTSYARAQNACYSPKTYNKEMRNAMKVKTGKTKVERINARLENLRQNNKYSDNFRNNLSTLFVVLILYGMISVPTFFIYIKLPAISRFVALVILAFICAFRSLKSARIFRIGIYKKSNAIFVGIYTFIFFPLVIEAIELL